ncbi:hypothetical protein AAFF_G00133900 [Aldrovandia affinis]|uniref:Uncharacterized protein n=1 Tax=Aldrovandia affinis TaxID=143900 RepID=A0AAD7WA10_9TELE|nr:hypothetical protein AAFF_G00133900 [Aldrovandia affinis]
MQVATAPKRVARAAVESSERTHGSERNKLKFIQSAPFVDLNNPRSYPGLYTEKGELSFGRKGQPEKDEVLTRPTH